MLYLEKAKIYGVDGFNQSATTLRRTGDAIGLTYSVGENEIQSDFDKCYPWSDMHEVVDKHGNVFIKVPKFYTKATKNSDGTLKLEISGVRYSGFSTFFIDGQGNELDYVLIGAFEGSGTAAQAFSKPNQTVLVNITQDNFRKACQANGAGYQMEDFLINQIKAWLFIVEFATSNSQSIMRGYTDGNAAAVQTGRTADVKTPSGSEISNTDGKHAFKYRGIENMWGNVWMFVDGVSFSGEKMYLCTDPAYYSAGKIDAPYFYVGNRVTSEGYAKKVNPLAKYPSLFFTSELGGSENSHLCDYYYYNANGQLVIVGGYWYDGSRAGLLYWGGDVPVSYSTSYVGGRLCYKPL